MKKFKFKKEEKFEIKEPIIQKVKEESIPVNKIEPFVTTNSEIVEKLQNKFNIRSISLDKDTGVRTFTFEAGRNEIEEYLRERS